MEKVLKKHLKGCDFLENAKFMSGLANGYFLFEKRGILNNITFFCCLSHVFISVEEENTNSNAHMDELMSYGRRFFG